MRHFVTYSFLTMLSLVIACGPEEIPIDVAPQESRIVISSRYIPGLFLTVLASRSFSALSPDDFERLEEDFVATLLVDSAFVTVTTDGTTDTLFEVVPGLFIGEVDHNPGSTYELTLYDSLSSTSVSANAALKSRVGFNNANVLVEIDGPDSAFQLTYEFDDPPEDNWYLVEARRVSGIMAFDFLEVRSEGDSTFVTVDSAFFFSENRVSEVIFTDLLSDLTFEDEMVTRTKDLVEDPGDTIVFTIINIDEDYFRFLDASKRTGGIIASATNEPINFPSNVEGGFGYFAMNQPAFFVYIREDN